MNGNGVAQHQDWRSRLALPNSDSLKEFTYRLSGKEDVVSSLTYLSAKLGFDYFSLALSEPRIVPARKSKAAVRSNYPDSWRDRYDTNSYSDHDPLIGLGRAASLPFLWGHQSDITGSTPLAERILSEGRSFRIRFGFSIPIHGPTGESTLVSMITTHGAKALEELVCDNYNLLWMISPLVHAASSKPSTVLVDESPIMLTQQEKICLQWTLRGKTSWEIAQIISRSTPTVEYHLQKAMRKFAVRTKIQAAVEAMNAGLVEP